MARNWMPALRHAGVQLVVSGHQHAWRIDQTAKGDPMQIVGGGADPRRGETVTVIVLDADSQSLRVTVQDAFAGVQLAHRELTRS